MDLLRTAATTTRTLGELGVNLQPESRLLDLFSADGLFERGLLSVDR